MMQSADEFSATIVLNDMDRSSFARYGFCSWLLQETEFSYEVIVNLFNEEKASFEMLTDAASSHCTPVIRVYDRPAAFNIAAANNLGLHYARGRTLIFANSDVIYPSRYLSSVIGELEQRNICYAVGNRANLLGIATKSLDSVSAYSSRHNFDFLQSWEHRTDRTSSAGNDSAWIVRREVAQEVGGFDPAILCHEDSEFSDRVMHYLRRKQLQGVLYKITDLLGYHMDHPESELYEMSNRSKSILEARRNILAVNPDSTEDVISTRLDNLDSLLRDLHKTEAIPAQKLLSGWFRSVSKQALKILRDALRQ